MKRTRHAGKSDHERQSDAHRFPPNPDLLPLAAEPPIHLRRGASGCVPAPRPRVRKNVSQTTARTPLSTPARVNIKETVISIA
jgi:hypothetical protein